MKILILKGNSRKNGSTEKLVKILADGIRSAGVEPESARLADLNIKPCKGCFACAKSPDSQCVIRDDMDALSQKFSNADIIVCATPVYFYSMSGIMKNFWDRTFPFVCGYERAGGDSWKNRTSLRVKNKTMLALSVASGGFENSFDAIKLTWETIAASLGFTLAANIVRTESLFFEHPNSKLSALNEIEAALREAGARLAKGEDICAETIGKITQKLSESDEVFAYNSNIFWEKLKLDKNAAKGGGKNSAELMSEMLESFRAEKAPESATLAFDFEDENSSAFFEIKNSEIKLLKGKPQSFDLKVSTTSSAWGDFLSGGSKAMEQLARREISLEGDRRLFAKFNRIFGLGKRRA